MVRVFSLLALAMALMLSGCASRVDYGDAQARETVTADFGSTDLQMIATKMVDDMMVFPPIVEMTRDRRPVLFVDRIKNKTSEHIDTESVTDTIQSKLINSGKFRFVDMSVVDRVREQLEYQQDSGMVDQASAAISTSKQKRLNMVPLPGARVFRSRTGCVCGSCGFPSRRTTQ